MGHGPHGHRLRHLPAGQHRTDHLGGPHAQPNGRVFLSDVLRGNEQLADAVNHLLVVGFYLVNLGFVALYLSGDQTIDDTRGIFEALSTKLGVVLLVLGVMHLGNVYVLNKIRRRGMMEREQMPPVGPQDWVAPQAGA